ncbi:hypothetical protein OEZ85_009772 [Tetradesmus obliquus]|uniref:Protein phosphatase inhibitor 2 n=1 Tax=Tetradesmus obliquus TaxID=3088 RepID=A0ABY8UA15_TETOB|nr:hypothetical protein OEZ85_009772 [Tetradesmus obliquus]
MRPLELDEEAAEQAQTAVMTAFDYVMRNGGANFTPPGPSHRRLQTASSVDADAAAAAAAPEGPPPAAADAAAADAVDGAVGDKRTEPCASFNSSGSDGPVSADKKQRFEAMRKQHYNMKQALQQAKQLLSEEEEDVQGEEELEGHEEGDEDDTAGWKAANGNAAAEGGSTHEEQQQQLGAVAGNGNQQQHGTAQQQQQEQLDGTDMEQTG